MSEQESKLSASLGELRRRKVFRVGVGYAVAAFVFLQVLSAFFSALELTPATQRLILVVTLAGFPLALFLAWAYDLTPRGIERTVEPESARSSRALELSIITLLALVVGSVGYLIYRPDGAGAPVGVAQAEVADRSIAVLPFTNMSDDPNADYFGDGLAEEILNVLATVPNLRVAARTSSFAYKGRNEDVRRIGNELNVATVLEGSVRKSGAKVRVTVQLINVADGFHLWSQNFDRELSDIFTIQDEIARAVAEALKVRLLGESASAARLGGTADVAAYDQYLLGRHHMQQRTDAGLLAAIGYFEQALAADPNYARAWSGLADAYNLLTGYGNLTPGQAWPKAEAAALRALALDPQLAEAHASLGLIRSNQGRMKEAVAELETAIELDPDYAPAQVWYGTVLGALKREAEQLAAYERAYQLDPSLPPAVSNLASEYAELGRYRDALPLVERMVRLRPADASFWHARIGDGLLELGVPAEAVLAHRRALEADPGNVDALAGTARAHLALGDLAAAERWLGHAERRGPRLHQTFVARVRLALARDDVDGALAAIRARLALSPSAGADGELTAMLFKVLVHGGRHAEAAAQLKALEAQYGAFAPDAEDFGLGPYVAATQRRAKREDAAQATLAATLAWIERQVEAGARRSDHHYAAAQAHALAGRPVEAVAALTLALQRGWQAATLARRDPLLASLRDDPGFVALLASVDAALAAQRKALGDAPPAPFEPAAVPTAVALTAAELDRLTGVYLSGDSNAIHQVRRVDDRLELVLGDQPASRLVPTAALEYFDEASGDRLTFVLGGDGRATHAVQRTVGREARIKKVAFELPQAGRADPARYPDYPGVYAFEPGFRVTITLADGRLYGRQDDKGQFELVAERDDVFFIAGAALRLRFVRDPQGAVTALRLQQVDSELEGARQPAAARDGT